MPRMRILSPSEQKAFDKSPLFDHGSGPRTRQGLRLDHALYGQIDPARFQGPGNVSWNTWITEAILEKLDREQEQKPSATTKGGRDV